MTESEPHCDIQNRIKSDDPHFPCQGVIFYAEGIGNICVQHATIFEISIPDNISLQKKQHQ